MSKNTKFVVTLSQLATRLGISRQTLNRWLKTYTDTPGKVDRGYEVEAWEAFIKARNLGRKEDLLNAGAEVPADMTELKRRQLQLRLEREEFELGREREKYLEVAHFERALGIMLSTFRQTLDALPSRCAGLLGDLDVRNQARELLRAALPKMRAAKTEDAAMQIAELELIRALPEPDFHFRRTTIENEVEIVKRTLRECNYMQPEQPTLTEQANSRAQSGGETPLTATPKR